MYKLGIDWNPVVIVDFNQSECAIHFGMKKIYSLRKRLVGH